MAKIEFSANHARKSASGGFQVIYNLNGAGVPFPKRTIDAKNMSDVNAAFEAYKAEAMETGNPMALSMRVKEGRAPSGFNAATAGHNFYTKINI